MLEKSFFFTQKMAKIQDNVNPGHCEIQYYQETNLINLFVLFKAKKKLMKKIIKLYLILKEQIQTI